MRFAKLKDGNILYRCLLGLPDANKKLKLKHVYESNNGQEISKISLLGSDTKLKWKAKGDKVYISTPDAIEMDKISTVFKIEFK